MFFYSVFLSPLSSLLSFFSSFFFSFLTLPRRSLSLLCSPKFLTQSLFLSLALAPHSQRLSLRLGCWAMGCWASSSTANEGVERLVVVRVESAFWYLFAWGLCLGGCHGIRWLVSLPLLGSGCRQNGLWWVWVYRRGYGGCGFGFAGVGVGVLGGCRC
jgi:hypothetical protein